MVYLLQHKYCLRCVQKTGESFPVCCIVASQLSLSKAMMLPKQPTKHIWCHSGSRSPLGCGGLCSGTHGALCAMRWGRHRDGTARSWAGSVPHPALPFPANLHKGDSSDSVMQMA